MIAAIWRHPVPDWPQRLATCIRDAAVARSSTTRVYFRADDVAVPGRSYREMIQVFSRQNVPLNLAVVPAWLTTTRWQALVRIGDAADHLWCWHQHGWRHHNHEPGGKKQEFGPARTHAALRQDLDRGRDRLEHLIGPRFLPVFTPPWNRCSAQTLDYLHRAGYIAVSRSRGSVPTGPQGLRELAVDIDWHTRKDVTAAAGWQALTAELSQGLTRPTCGFMLHHQRMSPVAVAALDHLLTLLKRYPRFALADFRSLCRP
jgi:hypothetical protein